MYSFLFSQSSILFTTTYNYVTLRDSWDLTAAHVCDDVRLVACCWAKNGQTIDIVSEFQSVEMIDHLVDLNDTIISTMMTSSLESNLLPFLYYQCLIQLLTWNLN